MVIPKGEIMDETFIANGEPTQRAVTITERGGKNGWMAAHARGRNLG